MSALVKSADRTLAILDLLREHRDGVDTIGRTIENVRETAQLLSQRMEYQSDAR